MGAILGVHREYADGNLPSTSNGSSEETVTSATKEEKYPDNSNISMAKTSQKRTMKPKNMKSGNVLSVIEDIQRLPNEAIHQEFDRLLIHTGRHFKHKNHRPCEDVSEKLQNCLYQNRDHACKCFNLMEEYRQCVYQATQSKLDLPVDDDPKPLLPLMPPVVLPKTKMPATKQQQQRQHSWWKFWLWFR